jgi:hypothetical protein
MVRNLCFESLQCHVSDDVRVISESYAEPRVQTKGPRFNTDFTLEFVDSEQCICDNQHRCIGSPVMPNTVGADLFLIVNKFSFEPLLLDLVGGEAFPISYFAAYIDAVESALTQTLQSAGFEVIPARKSVDAAIECARLRRSEYCRLMVVGGDACFLFFPASHTPDVRGNCYTLCDSDGVRIDCYVDGSDIVCFDGWVRVEVRESEQKLEAVWRDEPAY